jgi:hypothetical protein
MVRTLPRENRWGGEALDSLMEMQRPNARPSSLDPGAWSSLGWSLDGRPSQLTASFICGRWPSGRLMANLTGHTLAVSGSFQPGQPHARKRIGRGGHRQALARRYESRNCSNLPLPAGEVLYVCFAILTGWAARIAAFTGTEKHPFTRLWFAPSMAEIAVAEGGRLPR